MKKIILIIIVLLLQTGLMSMSELKRYDARGDSLAGAILSLGSDGNALTANPALLALQEDMRFTLSVSPRSVSKGSYGLNQLGVKGVVPVIEGEKAMTLGFSYDGLLYTVNSDMAYYEYQLSAGGGIDFNGIFQSGVGVSLHNYTLGDEEGGVPVPFLAFDLGFSTVLKGIHLGLAGRSLGTLSLRSDEWSREVVSYERDSFIAAGAGYIYKRWQGEFNLEYLIQEKRFDLRSGVEWLLKNKYRFAFGAAALGFRSYPLSSGFGILFNKLAVDYSITVPIPSGPYKAGIHKFSLSFNF